MKGDKVIKPSKYFQMQKDADVYTLRISEAFPEDEGVYKCVATNSVGDCTLSAELRVLGKWKQDYQSIKHSIGEQFNHSSIILKHEVNL